MVNNGESVDVFIQIYILFYTWKVNSSGIALDVYFITFLKAFSEWEYLYNNCMNGVYSNFFL